MTQNSLLSKFCTENPNWEEYFKERYVNIHRKNGFIMFRYDIRAKFNKPLMFETRSTILYEDTFDVAAFPFKKFANYNQVYADKIDWESAVIEEKIDGSLCFLWFDVVTAQWQLSTSNCIDAHDVVLNQVDNKSVYDIFYEILSDKYPDFNLDSLNPKYTYMFELTYRGLKIESYEIQTTYIILEHAQI